MKFKIRQLPNDMFITEAKRWHDFTWKGVYVDSAYTNGAVEHGLTEGVPTVEFVAPGHIHYPLCLAKDVAEAARNIIQVVSILGLEAQAASEAYDKSAAEAEAEADIAEAYAKADAEDLKAYAQSVVEARAKADKHNKGMT